MTGSLRSQLIIICDVIFRNLILKITGADWKAVKRIHK
jgi:hypothetical protein